MEVFHKTKESFLENENFHKKMKSCTKCIWKTWRLSSGPIYKRGCGL